MSALLDHQALPFDDLKDLTSAIARVAGQALQQGRPVATVLPDDLSDRVRERLGGDVDALDVLNYDSCYDVAPQALACFVDKVSGYVRDGHRPTLIGGSMLVRRESAEVLAWMQMEAVLNDALADADAHVVCCYPRTGLDPWVTAAAISTHPSILVGGRSVPNACYLQPLDFLAANPEPPAPHLGEPDAALVFDRGALRTVRALIAEHAARAGLSQMRIEKLTMAVNEAVTNTVEYGPGTGVVRLWAGPLRLTCEVHDSGRLAEPYMGLLPPAPASPRGRGLWLIRQLPDLTQMWSDDTGTTIRMTVGG